MSRWTIIPVRGLAAGKSRLAPALDAHARAALNRQLLETVLAAVAGAEGGLARCIVAAGADDAAQLARLHGAQVLRDTGRGDLNAALEAARRCAREAGATSILALVADLPFAGAAALARLFAAVPAAHGALVPDKQRVGTTGLLLPAHCPVDYMFGPDSLARHRQALGEQQVPTIEWDDCALGFDLDTPADYLLWQAATAGGGLPDFENPHEPDSGQAPGRGLRWPRHAH